MKNYIARRNDNGLSLFDEAFGNFFKPMFFDSDLENMKTDIKELENSYEMEIEMPGFSKGDIDLSLEDGYLTVRAQKQEKEESKDGKYLRKERSVSCSRSYYVGDAKEEDVKAKYDNGILKIEVPKETEKKIENKKILIE